MIVSGSLFYLQYFSLSAQDPTAMPKNEPPIKEVLKDKSLIGGRASEERALARRYAKGTGQRQRVEFSRGTYANLRELKHFYRRLFGGIAPSYSLIIRRALDLLVRRISSMRQMRDLYDEKYLFSLLSSEGRKGKSHEEIRDQNS